MSMNSFVLGVATPCFRPSTNVKNRWLIAWAMSWLMRTDSCSWLITRPSGRDLSRDAAAQNAATRRECRILLRIGRGIDQHGPFGNPKLMAFVNR